jgi:hypothetical protein
MCIENRKAMLQISSMSEIVRSEHRGRVQQLLRQAPVVAVLDRLHVVHAGARTFPLGERLWAVALRDLLRTDLGGG